MTTENVNGQNFVNNFALVTRKSMIERPIANATGSTLYKEAQTPVEYAHESATSILTIYKT